MSAEHGLAPTLEIEVGTRDGKAVCVARGEMSAPTVMAFVAAVDLSIGEPELVVDLSGVRVIDEAGIRALLDVVGRARDRGAYVAVVVAAGAVRKVLEQAGLDRMVRVSETL